MGEKWTREMPHTSISQSSHNNHSHSNHIKRLEANTGREGACGALITDSFFRLYPTFGTLGSPFGKALWVAPETNGVQYYPIPAVVVASLCRCNGSVSSKILENPKSTDLTHSSGSSDFKPPG